VRVLNRTIPADPIGPVRPMGLMKIYTKGLQLSFSESRGSFFGLKKEKQTAHFFVRKEKGSLEESIL
jgi:hypothetical protein